MLLKICAYPGCSRACPADEKYCDRHREAGEQLDRAARKRRFKQQDRSRESAYRRGYTNAWARARACFLASHPLCAHCLAKGLHTPATEVDHIKPHRGDKDLFWDSDNWQALCKACHSRKTATEDSTFAIRKGSRRG